MERTMKRPLVSIAFALIAFWNFALWYLGDWSLLSYLVGMGTGASIVAIGLLASEEYERRSSSG
jgi:hypothetical protein